jgi:hypothetical protein
MESVLGIRKTDMQYIETFRPLKLQLQHKMFNTKERNIYLCLQYMNSKTCDESDSKKKFLFNGVQLQYFFRKANQNVNNKLLDEKTAVSFKGNKAVRYGNTASLRRFGMINVHEVQLNKGKTPELLAANIS